MMATAATTARQAWVRKGPFLVRESAGELHVYLDEGAAWPEKKSFAVVRDEEGLPVMFWRESDGQRNGFSMSGGISNGKANWAPRGCFVWQAQGEQILFVHVNRDGPFPRLRAVLWMASWLACAGLSYALWHIAQLSFLIFLGVMLATLPFILMSYDARAWGRRPLTYSWVPWRELEGFELTNPISLNLRVTHTMAGYRTRTILLGLFGDRGEMRIMDGVWTVEQARRWLRTLKMEFMDKRAEHFRKLDLDHEGRSLQASA